MALASPTLPSLKVLTALASAAMLLLLLLRCDCAAAALLTAVAVVCCHTVVTRLSHGCRMVTWPHRVGRERDSHHVHFDFNEIAGWAEKEDDGGGGSVTIEINGYAVELNAFTTTEPSYVVSSIESIVGAAGNSVSIVTAKGAEIPETFPAWSETEAVNT